MLVVLYRGWREVDGQHCGTRYMYIVATISARPINRVSVTILQVFQQRRIEHCCSANLSAAFVIKLNYGIQQPRAGPY